MVRSAALASILVVMVGLASSAQADEPRGELVLRFVYDGTPPAMRSIKNLTDQKVCGGELLDESLVVGANGGIQNVFVWMAPEEGETVPAPTKPAPETVELTIERCRLQPHALTATAGQTLKITNKDQVGHAVRPFFVANRPFSPLIPVDDVQTHAMTKAERRVIPLSCSIHPWITGHLMVAPTTYNAVSDEQGVVRIADVPPGKRAFRVWHEAFGAVVQPRQGEESRNWPKGVVAIDVQAGENDLGEFRIAHKPTDQ